MVACTCPKESFAARAKHIITIQTPTHVGDDTGGRQKHWSDGEAAWAIIEPKNGREVYVSGQLQSRCDSLMTIRYRSALANTKEAARLRVVFEERVYNITAVRNVGRDMKGEGTDFQLLFCVEGEPS